MASTNKKLGNRPQSVFDYIRRKGLALDILFRTYTLYGIVS